jgi:hypothetical protein
MRPGLARRIVDEVDSVVKADGIDGADDVDGSEDIDCSYIGMYGFEGPDITRPSTRPPTFTRLGVKGPVTEGADDVNGADDAGGADDADSDPDRLEGPDIGGPDGSG